MIDRFQTSVSVALLCLAAPAFAAGKLELVRPPLVVISSDTPNGTGVITLHNSGDAAVTPKLALGAFFSDANESLPITTKPLLSPAIDPGQTVDIPVELSNVTERGAAKAELRDGATRLGELRVLKRVFAFNVAPVGYDGKQPFPLHLIYGRKATVTLLNSDGVTHSFLWSLREGERELAGDRVQMLRPGAATDIVIPARSASSLQWLEGTLQSPQSQGRLVLRAVPHDATDKETWVSKEVPLQLKRTAGEGVARDLWQLLWILIFLLAGGLASLYLTYWVPNTLKKIDVKARVEDLTWKIHQLSHTPSTLRVLLSVQRNQLRALLNSRNVLSLDFLPLAAECEKQADALQRRVELVQKIEYLRLAIEREWESGTMLLGPTILRRAARLLQASVDQLEQGQLTEDEMRAVEAQVAEAAQDLRSTAEDPKLTQEVVGRAKDLQKRKTALAPIVKDAVDLAPALEDVEADTLAWPIDFWKLDYAVTKLEIAARVESPSPELLGLLRLRSLEAFEEAVSVSRQIREKKTPEEWKKAFDEKKVEIRFHPQRPEVNALVSFELKLDPELKAASARQNFTCRWDFGDKLHEHGWRVSHYFIRPGKFSVNAAVAERAKTAEMEVAPVEVEVTPRKDELLGSRTRIEWIRLGVALFIVLLGLIAGAKEQIAKLDFVAALLALFLLGVTTDQIKNLLSPPKT